MKYKFLCVSALAGVLLLSCSTPQQSFQKTQQPIETPREEIVKKTPDISPLPPSKQLPRTPGPLHCVEDTRENFNRSGIDAIPFIRVSFFDTGGTGLKDMIAGSKDGSVFLYKNSGDPLVRPWQFSEGYFNGAKVGAFSSPAMGDIDGSGEAELVVGTGGFSSDSGRILFFRNVGSRHSPIWKKLEGMDLKIGNDAAISLVDYNFY